MRICDITVADIRSGKNWLARPTGARWWDRPMEEWGPLIEAVTFSKEDRIVYSGLTAYRSGWVKPIVLWKQVGDMDYGGDYCEFVDGVWRQVGLNPNPNAELGDSYIANPLSIDDSFSDDEYREYHRQRFRLFALKL